LASPPARPAAPTQRQDVVPTRRRPPRKRPNWHPRGVWHRAARRPRSARLPGTAGVPSVIARAARTVAPATSAGSSPAPLRTTRFADTSGRPGKFTVRICRPKEGSSARSPGTRTSAAAPAPGARQISSRRHAALSSSRGGGRGVRRGHVCQHNPVIRSQHLRGHDLDVRRTHGQDNGGAGGLIMSGSSSSVAYIDSRSARSSTLWAPPVPMSRSGRELAPARPRSPAPGSDASNSLLEGTLSRPPGRRRFRTVAWPATMDAPPISPSEKNATSWASLLADRRR